MVYSRQQAPGDLGRLEAFCNSARFLYGEDAFADTVAATRWLREHEFVPDGFELADDELGGLVGLRETVRGHLAGTDPANIAVELNRLADALLAGPEWTGTGEPRIRVHARTAVDELSAELLTIVFTADVRGELARLKPCQAPECLWVFYDRSPRGNSIWCSMRICGARHKMRSYRTRERA